MMQAQGHSFTSTSKMLFISAHHYPPILIIELPGSLFAVLWLPHPAGRYAQPRQRARVQAQRLQGLGAHHGYGRGRLQEGEVSDCSLQPRFSACRLGLIEFKVFTEKGAIAHSCRPLLCFRDVLPQAAPEPTPGHCGGRVRMQWRPGALGPDLRAEGKVQVGLCGGTSVMCARGHGRCTSNNLQFVGNATFKALCSSWVSTMCALVGITRQRL